MVAYFGTVQNGQIKLRGNEELAEGAEVIVTLAEQDQSDVQGITVAELLAAPFIGAWADRDDIGNSVAFVEELRRRAERRE